MLWSCKVIYDEENKKYIKAIIDNDDNVILNVEAFSDTYINTIVNEHNNAIFHLTKENINSLSLYFTK